MKEFSNNTLFIIAVIIIAISLFSIALPFGEKLGITGMAGTTSAEGTVNVTVPSTASLTVHTKSINFTETPIGSSKTSYLAVDVDTNCDALNCIPCDADNHCGMNVTNDGTSDTFINITIYASEALFTSGSYLANSHWLYNVTMQDPGYTTDYGAKGNCSVGYDQGLSGVGGWGNWRGVPTVAEHGICYLNASDDLGSGNTESSDTRPDVARVEFNITVPEQEGSGDKAGTITFTAVAS